MHTELGLLASDTYPTKASGIIVLLKATKNIT